MNEMIGSARNNRFGSASMKKKWTNLVTKAAINAKLEPIKVPVHLDIDWYEGDKRRDLDNVSAATKFVLDGIVKAGVLVDDSQKWVKGITHEIYTTKNKTYGVRVTFFDY